MRIFLFSLLFSVSLIICAQNDKVYFKNSSVVRGTISQTALTDTVLVSIDKNTVPIPLEIVDEIRFSRRNGVRPEGYKDYVYQRGFATGIETGILIGDQVTSDASGIRPAFELTQEYQYHPFLNGGITVGIHYYYNYMILPIALNYHMLLGKRHKSWLVYGRLGYSFVKSRFEQENIDTTGGLLYQTGIAWQQRIGDDSFRIKLGYSAQTVRETQDTGSSTFYIARERRMNRLNIQVAYLFKY